MRARIVFGIVGSLFALPNAAWPQAATVAADVDSAVTSWITANNVARAEVAVYYRDHLVKSYNHGWRPNEPHIVASLSKAITGLCIAGLMDSGKLKPSDTLGGIFFKPLSKLPPNKRLPTPRDPAFKNITVGQLLTHTAGIDKNIVSDSTDVTMEDGFKSAMNTNPILVLAPGQVSYSDTGYLILGIIAEKVANQAYYPFCKKVLGPGATGTLDRTQVARAPNGGWDESAEEYGKFLYAFNSQSGVMKQASRGWMEALPANSAYELAHGDPPWPGCPNLPGIAKPSYAFGACISKSPRGLQFYHSGEAHVRPQHPPNHPEYYTIPGGSFYFANEIGYAAVVIFSADKTGGIVKNSGPLMKGIASAMTSHAAYVFP